MVTYDPAEYIDVHLRYEIKYLVVAATTWAAVADEKKRETHAPHLVVMAMESAFVHARGLAQFLGEDPKWPRLRVHTPVTIPAWDALSDAVHEKVLHLNPRRPYEPAGTPADNLKNQVVVLAKAVVDAWGEVARQPRMAPYRELMANVKVSAIEDGREVAAHFGIPPVWS